MAASILCETEPKEQLTARTAVQDATLSTYLRQRFSRSTYMTKPTTAPPATRGGHKMVCGITISMYLANIKRCQAPITAGTMGAANGVYRISTLLPHAVLLGALGRT